MVSRLLHIGSYNHTSKTVYSENFSKDNKLDKRYKTTMATIRKLALTIACLCVRGFNHLPTASASASGFGYLGLLLHSPVSEPSSL